MITRVAALLKTPAARDGALVIGAQGVAALIALGVNSFLFHRLSLSEQGALAAGTNLSSTLLQFSDLGLALTTIRLGAKYLADGKPGKAAALFRTTLLIRIAAAVLVILLTVQFSGHFASGLLSMPNGRALVMAAAFGVFGNAVAWWGIDVAQARRQLGSYAVQQIFGAFSKAAAVAVVFALWFTGSAAGAPEMLLLSIAAANLCSGLLGLLLEGSPTVVANRNENVTGEIKREIRLIEFGAYACAISVLTAFLSNADVLLVQHFLKEEDTAVFNCARQLALALNLIATATITVLLPRAAALNSAEQCAAYVRKALKAGVLLALFSAGGLALAARIFVPLFGGPKYTAAIPILQWLCIAHGVSIAITPLMLVLYPLRREWMIVFLTALQLAVLLALGPGLTEAFGLRGAAWTAVSAKATAGIFTIFLLLWALKHTDAVSKSEKSATLLP